MSRRDAPKTSRQLRAAEVPKPEGGLVGARPHAERPVGDGGDVALAVGEERGGGGRAAGEGGRGRLAAGWRPPHLDDWLVEDCTEADVVALWRLLVLAVDDETGEERACGEEEAAA